MAIFPKSIPMPEKLPIKKDLFLPISYAFDVEVWKMIFSSSSVENDLTTLIFESDSDAT